MKVGVLTAFCHDRDFEDMIKYLHGIGVQAVELASGGYPGSYEKGIEIHGLDDMGQVEGATVYHAGTAVKDGEFVTAGGRVLGVTATGETLEAALQKAYDAVEHISFTGAHYRKDIGHAADDLTV